jgi:hypothetical protein
MSRDEDFDGHRAVESPVPGTVNLTPPPLPSSGRGWRHARQGKVNACRETISLHKRCDAKPSERNPTRDNWSNSIYTA